MTPELKAWLEAEDAARKHYAAKHGLAPEEVDVLSAALEALRLSDSMDLLTKKWKGEDLINLIATADFQALRGIQEITFEKSLLPPEIFGRIDEKTFDQNGEKWRIHKNDVDPFPSVPHAHNLYTGLTLDLYNGNLYDKRKRVGRMREKELRELRARAGLELPVSESGRKVRKRKKSD